jgi:hypothetical protein
MKWVPEAARGDRTVSMATTAVLAPGARYMVPRHPPSDVTQTTPSLSGPLGSTAVRGSLLKPKKRAL